MNKFETFIHNDITWCANTDCEHTACFRHMNNRIPEEGCNIFNKYTYGQKIDLNAKFNKLYGKLNKGEISKKIFAKKMTLKIDMIKNFGITPYQVFKSNVKLNSKFKLEPIRHNSYKLKNCIYFINLKNDIIVLYKNPGQEQGQVFEKKKSKDKKLKEKESNQPKEPIKSIKYISQSDEQYDYPCGFIKQGEKIKIEDIKVPIFRPYYSLSYFKKNNNIFVLSCRYIGNIFKIQCPDYSIDVLCEDFVSCIHCKSEEEQNNVFFYTGLKNGKVSEWVVIPKNQFGTKKILMNVKERRHFRGHKGEVTCIEIYKSQNVIITGGTDKILFIRKIHDFELLTVIDLIYSYGNPIISEKFNIVPTLIRVSELNCIYVLLHNYEEKKSFIRGYNLNGIFFKQSAEDYYTNFTFTKNGNLMISKANSSNIYLFNCYDLEEIKDIEFSVSDISKNSNIKSDDNIVWFDYNYLSRELILMFDNSIYKGNLEEEQQRIIDCY